MKDEIENNSNEGFMSRWSKRKSIKKSDQVNTKTSVDKIKFKNDEVKEQNIIETEENDEKQYDALNDQELLDKFKLPDPEKIKKEKGLDLFFKDGINQSELAILMDMEKAPLSRLLDRMEIKGWVIRKNESKDRRTKNIYLSESVKPLISSMRDKAADYRSESLSILTNKDLNKLKEILQILKKDLTSKI